MLLPPPPNPITLRSVLFSSVCLFVRPFNPTRIRALIVPLTNPISAALTIHSSDNQFITSPFSRLCVIYHRERLVHIELLLELLPSIDTVEKGDTPYPTPPTTANSRTMNPPYPLPRPASTITPSPHPTSLSSQCYPISQKKLLNLK